MAARPDADPAVAAWDRRNVTALALLVIGALAARLRTLPLRHVVEGDGVHYASLARDVLVANWSGLGNPYWSNLWPGTIALTSLVSGLGVVEAGRAASLVAGTLLPALIAVLAARLFGRTTGLAAGVAAAGHPWLVHFSTLVFTESFFAALLVSLLFAGWRAARSAGTGPSLVAGFLAGLALVTRPEAWAAVLAILGLTAAKARRQRALLPPMRKALAILAPIALLLSARALLVHRYYSVWDFGIGSKGTANLLLGLADDEAAKERVSNEITPDGENSLDHETRTTSVVAFALRNPGLVLAHVGSNLRRLVVSGRRVFPPLPVSLGRSALRGELWSWAVGVTSAVMVVIGILGLASGLEARETREGSAYLGGTGALYVLGLAPLNVHDRLVVALVPLFLVFLGLGLVRLTRGGGGKRLPLLIAALVALAVFSAIVVVRAPALAYGDDPVVQKEAGGWLAARYSRDLKLMTPCPAIAFYFYDAARQDNEIDLPWAPYEGVLDFARREGVAILAAPEWHLRAVRHPAAPALLDPAGAHPGLEFLATIGDEAPYRVQVYRVAEAPR